MANEPEHRSSPNRRQLRRTVAVLALTAAAIYLGFIVRAMIS
jgi:hypothetical protein